LKKLCLAFLTSLLAACSSDHVVMDHVQTQYSDVEKLTAQLRAPQAPPVSLDQIDFQKVSLDRNNRIDITIRSPIVSFPEGNSYIAALLLPEKMSRFTFNLVSYVGRTIFIPEVLFLDENRQEVMRINDPQFNYENNFTINQAISSEKAPRIRYVVIYSKDSVLDGKSEMRDIAREYEAAKGAVLSEGSYPKPYTKHSPIGSLDLNLEQVFLSAQNVESFNQENQYKVMQAVSPAKTPVILSDTEAFYLEQIRKAVKAGDDLRAKSLVEEAERAGSTKANAYYLKLNNM